MVSHLSCWSWSCSLNQSLRLQAENEESHEKDELMDHLLVMRLVDERASLVVWKSEEIDLEAFIGKDFDSDLPVVVSRSRTWRFAISIRPKPIMKNHSSHPARNEHEDPHFALRIRNQTWRNKESRCSIPVRLYATFQFINNLPYWSPPKYTWPPIADI